jgi:hypothetical protein
LPPAGPRALSRRQSQLHRDGRQGSLLSRVGRAARLRSPGFRWLEASRPRRRGPDRRRAAPASSEHGPGHNREDDLDHG